MSVEVTSEHRPVPVGEVPAAPVAVAAPSIPSAAPKGASTVMNFTRFGKVDVFNAMRDAILSQMSANPERFADDIVASYASKLKYANEFAAHMLDKLSTESVKVLNETSIAALESIKKNYAASLSISLKGLYGYLFEGGKPIHSGTAAGDAIVAAKPKFKGC
jgi:hypothetical protein